MRGVRTFKTTEMRYILHNKIIVSELHVRNLRINVICLGIVSYLWIDKKSAKKCRRNKFLLVFVGALLALKWNELKWKCVYFIYIFQFILIRIVLPSFFRPHTRDFIILLSHLILSIRFRCDCCCCVFVFIFLLSFWFLFLVFFSSLI